MRLFALLCGLLPAVSLAQTFTAPGQSLSVAELAHARGVGMGGAFRGLGQSPEAVMGNPASLSMVRGYQIEMTGAWDAATRDGFGSVALRDSATSEVAAGIGYQFLKTGRGANASYGHLTTLALSLPVVQWLTLGVSGHYLNVSGATTTNAGTLDAGLALRPLGGLVVGFSVHNIVDTSNPELLRYYSWQLGWLGQSFALGLDVRSTLQADNGAPLLNVGGEYVIGKLIPIRAGYSREFGTQQNFFSAGAGVTGESVGVDVAYRHEFGGNESRLLVLTFKIQL
ncbi:MAG: hypothetical protein ACKVPX_15765 [Myxococcaceae bacterium]